MVNKNYRNGRKNVHYLQAHLILTPVYRGKVFTKTVRDSVYDSFKKVCDRSHITILDFDTNNDHAHLLINYPPSVSLSVLIGQLKTHSTRVLKRDYFDSIEVMLCDGSFWCGSYFVGNDDSEVLDRIREYIVELGKEPRGAGNPLLGKF